MSARSGYRGYVTGRPFCGQRAPQHVQNLVIRDYAQRHGLLYKLSAVEHALPGAMVLGDVLAELPRLEGIICYSLLQLPEDGPSRRDALRRVLACGASLHCAVEELAIRSEDDVARAEELWALERILPECERAAAELRDELGAELRVELAASGDL